MISSTTFFAASADADGPSDVDCCFADAFEGDVFARAGDDD
jgi:hypothetical protein